MTQPNETESVPGGEEEVAVGLVAAREGSIDLAREVAEELPGVLGERLPACAGASR